EREVVRAELSCQARQQSPEGARPREFEPELRVQAAEGRLNRMAESVEPVPGTLLVRAWGVVAGEQHRRAPVSAPMLAPGSAATTVIGQSRASQRLAGAHPAAQRTTRAAPRATQPVSWTKHLRQFIGGGWRRVRLIAPAEECFCQPVLFR